jgi:protein tyrosine/serine phosphatase
VLASLVILVLGVVTYAIVQVSHSNFHVVVPGEVYRAGQMNPDQLARCLTNHHIRSVLNLRGVNGGEQWYRGETQAVARLGVGHFDMSWSSSEEIGPKQLSESLGLLRSAPKPLLIHCDGGADRTGLASALYRYAVQGQTAATANGELSLWYGHLPWFRPQVLAMDRSFWNFVSNQTSQASTTTPTASP